MRYRIEHKTTYRYAGTVAQSHHMVHLSPRITTGQFIESHDLTIEPHASADRKFTDYFGNPARHLIVEEDHSLLSVRALSFIRVERDHSKYMTQTKTSWEQVRDLMFDAERHKEAEFSCQSPFTPVDADIAEYAAQSFAPGRPILEAVMELTGRIFEDFEYDSSATDVSTQVDKVFEIRKGVCQDFAHFQLTCLRSLGLPARYVSGYLRTYPPEGQPRLVGADASHAWISVWCPEADWVDFDPTNNKMIAEEHITLTIGRDFGDVSPISGIILGGGSHYIDVSVDVMPIDEAGNEIGKRAEAKAGNKDSAAGASPSQSPQSSQSSKDSSQSSEKNRVQEQGQQQFQPIFNEFS